MADQRTDDLPEGTDTIIEGAANTSGGADPTGMAAASEDSMLGSASESGTATSTGSTSTGSSGTSTGSSGTITERLRSGREQLTSQAGEKARGLVGQGLERSSEALANVSRMVGDTAAGIEERLGAEYGDYARRAAGAIENVANSLAEKNPDELMDDTRNFVRNSPGIALAGAAVVGFVVARLVKSGISGVSGNDEDDGDRDGEGDRA
ncbi:MAG TPA: hypothetical protein VIL42_11195 [Sphingomicrobium sp.]|jgi:ElaB/YqjD/DUF883 family membrane-anchored ribosome-binding protein